jgi:hypothetical protein
MLSLYAQVNITFDSVVVNNASLSPWGTKYYYCEGVASGRATGTTWPVPPCFADHTIRNQVLP